MSLKWSIPALMAAKGGVPLDASAQAFITAAGITDPTQKTAINDAFVYGKSVGLLDSSNILNSKIVAMYMMVGGTSTTCMYNAIDPRDLDAAYRLTFSGSWVFSSTGALPNGSDTNADTHLVWSTFSVDDIHLSYYSGTNDNSSFQVEFGTGSGTLPQFCIKTNFSDETLFQIPGSNISVAATNTDGHFIGSAKGASNYLYKNGTQITSGSTLAGTANPDNIFLGARGTSFYTKKECRFATIGVGLDGTDLAHLYTLIQNFNTTLGRQV